MANTKKKNKRTTQICLMVTKEEREEITRKAREEDRSVNDYIRHKLLGAKKILD